MRDGHQKQLKYEYHKDMGVTTIRRQAKPNRPYCLHVYSPKPTSVPTLPQYHLLDYSRTRLSIPRSTTPDQRPHYRWHPRHISQRYNTLVSPTPTTQCNPYLDHQYALPMQRQLMGQLSDYLSTWHLLAFHCNSNCPHSHSQLTTHHLITYNLVNQPPSSLHPYRLTTPHWTTALCHSQRKKTSSQLAFATMLPKQATSIFAEGEVTAPTKTTTTPTRPTPIPVQRLDIAKNALDT